MRWAVRTPQRNSLFLFLRLTSYSVSTMCVASYRYTIHMTKRCGDAFLLAMITTHSECLVGGTNEIRSCPPSSMNERHDEKPFFPTFHSTIQSSSPPRHYSNNRSTTALFYGSHRITVIMLTPPSHPASGSSTSVLCCEA
jgi:hypothetical protein